MSLLSTTTTTRSTTKNGSRATAIGEMKPSSRLLEPIHEEGQPRSENNDDGKEEEKEEEKRLRSIDPFLACRHGDLELVKRLIGKANCNERESSGRRSSCLHFAAGFGRRDVCDYLLNECGADPSIKDEG